MALVEVGSEIVAEVEVLLVDVDLAGVHQEVGAGLEIAVDSGTVVEVGAVDHFQVAEEDREEALAREEVDSEEGDESIFYLYLACI